MTTGDAGVLRRAAALMRERAQAATPNPWRIGEHESLGLCEVWGDDDGWNAWMVCTTLTRLNPHPSVQAHSDAEHIAGMHPAVALAVADWLDVTAEHIASHECEAECAPGGCPSVLAAAAVARAYLNGGSP